ncbi:MAG TPA: MoxR family ATPase [Candidatus Nanoarchaeia archaeon]|nr:MoxR family ATPase [Candidatus Nanoarchaeia archaeon]
MKTVEEVQQIIAKIMKEAAKVVVGQEETLKQIIIAILTDNHALLEGAPGLAKTLCVKTIAALMDLKFSRIQGTPDLMPSDITGTYLLEERAGKKEFRFEPGPVFANIILFDEINRAVPRTQSALLEAMQERQVTVGKQTFKLEPPFFVLATQNPIEQEGVNYLPEAQADRFLFKIRTDYPSYTEELDIITKYTEGVEPAKLTSIIKKEHLFAMQSLVREVPVANDLKKYVVDIVNASRNKKDLIEIGASPRASIGLILAAKAHALLAGRKYVSKEDINAMAPAVLRHRLILSFEAERNNLKEDDVIKKLLR